MADWYGDVTSAKHRDQAFKQLEGVLADHMQVGLEIIKGIFTGCVRQSAHNNEGQLVQVAGVANRGAFHFRRKGSEFPLQPAQGLGVGYNLSPETTVPSIRFGPSL